MRRITSNTVELTDVEIGAVDRMEYLLDIGLDIRTAAFQVITEAVAANAFPALELSRKFVEYLSEGTVALDADGQPVLR